MMQLRKKTEKRCWHAVPVTSAAEAGEARGAAAAADGAHDAAEAGGVHGAAEAGGARGAVGAGGRSPEAEGRACQGGAAGAGGRSQAEAASQGAVVQTLSRGSNDVLFPQVTKRQAEEKKTAEQKQHQRHGLKNAAEHRTEGRKKKVRAELQHRNTATPVHGHRALSLLSSRKS